eukprot:scaffold272197_cov35-Tisochrysis_lutea.AAC.2
MSFASPAVRRVRREEGASSPGCSLLQVRSAAEMRPEPVPRRELPLSLVPLAHDEPFRLACWGCGMPPPPATPSKLKLAALAPHRQCGICVKQCRSPAACFCSSACATLNWKRHLAWHADRNRPPLIEAEGNGEHMGLRTPTGDG